jgi:hypothetical protein
MTAPFTYAKNQCRPHDINNGNDINTLSNDMSLGAVQQLINCLSPGLLVFALSPPAA